MLDDERGGNGDDGGAAGGGGGKPRTRARNVVPDDQGGTRSSWMRDSVPDFDRTLPAELAVDVCIIGAGIAGLSTAYHLTRAGLKVCVVDDGPIGGGETSRTTAHLASALDDRFHHLEHVHGRDGARLAAASHAAAIDDIERIAATHSIECDFRRVDGYLFAPPGGDTKELDQELSAAKRAGLEVEALARAPIPGFDTGPCLRFARQAQFHPVRYLAGLARAIVEGGGRIVTGAHATDLADGAVKVTVEDGERSIRAPSVVVATNPPITSRVEFPLRQAPYRTYVIAMHVGRGMMPAALFWDTADPYHSVRTATTAEGDLLIVGGEDHRVGQDEQPEKRWQRLESWARERFPVTTTVDRWSGQCLEPADGLAFIGRIDGKGGEQGGVYMVTGDSGNGMTHGAIAGMLLTDLITGRPNPWAKLYDPKRTSLRGLRHLLGEAAKSSAPYSDWLKAGDVKAVKDIAPGSGAVLRQGLHLLAVYRDEEGGCHVRSATCPHLGGVVSWNSAEKSWDCPCHGSRFDARGRLLEGPANDDLAEAMLAEQKEG
jgi:glycine/D-amino acid oxidase-like deaminating enzyme/nitrite reductase/ring-hydroxylating ferredoxin subunit